MGCNGHNGDGGVPASGTGSKHVYPKNKQLWDPGFQTLICVTEMPVTALQHFRTEVNSYRHMMGSKSVEDLRCIAGHI